MPIPVPKSSSDLGPCIEALKREGYDNQDQRVAICLNLYRKSLDEDERTGRGKTHEEKEK